MPPQRRFGRTALEKWKICQARQQPGQKAGEMTLDEFCKLFPNPDGKPMPLSTMSTMLRKTDLSDPPEGASAIKMKDRREQFPIFERLLAEWIAKAIFAKVLISDEVIKEQGRTLIWELGQRCMMADILHFEENYTGFELSSGWLAGFKVRNGLGKQKFAGNAGSTDPALVGPARERMQKALVGVAPQNVYNIDETALQYNLRPCTTIGHKGKTLQGEKKDKTRITVFFVVNADGSHKYNLSVINKYKQPLCFKAAGVNIANLPIYYYYNKTAWMQVSVWFNFLNQFNEYMRIALRQVILISDNAPTHPHSLSPPKNYTGRPPPHLTHINLIYIDPNLTAYLQPLDAGIIAAFKAAYRRRYASLLISRFNSNPTASVNWKLNILEAINLAVEAWDCIPPSTIFHCWQKTGILVEIDRSNVGRYEEFLSNLQVSTKISIATLLNHDEKATTSVIEDITEGYLNYDEDIIHSHVEPITIPMHEHVYECIQAGLTTLDGMDNDLESLYEGDISLTPPPIINGLTALTCLDDLSQYFRSLSISLLPSVPGTPSSGTNISDLVKVLSTTRQSLHQHLESQKKQSNLDGWVQHLS